MKDFIQNKPLAVLFFTGGCLLVAGLIITANSKHFVRFDLVVVGLLISLLILLGFMYVVIQRKTRSQQKFAHDNVVLEKKIAEQEQQLASASKELEAFSYSVAHDLRTPVRAVMGYSAMLVEDYTEQFDSEGRRLLGELQHNTRKIGRQLEGLLIFSGLYKKQLNRSLVDMRPIIESALSTIPVNGAVVNVGKLYPIKADVTLMKQVMTNLLSNAVKYSSGNERAVITITSEHKDDQVIYSVADNGVGFDMNFAGKLFGVFQRLHADDEFEGTGMGLAIVQRIVNRLGGKTWAYAEVNKGATFYFSLPRDLEVENSFVSTVS